MSFWVVVVALPLVLRKRLAIAEFIWTFARWKCGILRHKRAKISLQHFWKFRISIEMVGPGRIPITRRHSHNLSGAIILATLGGQILCAQTWKDPSRECIKEGGVQKFLPARGFKDIPPPPPPQKWLLARKGGGGGVYIFPAVDWLVAYNLAKIFKISRA